jgi:hypothetical protein
MDWLTVRRCAGADVAASACSAAGGRGMAADNACTAAGGSCEVLRDGFYLLAGARFSQAFKRALACGHMQRRR